MKTILSSGALLLFFGVVFLFTGIPMVGEGSSTYGVSIGNTRGEVAVGTILTVGLCQNTGNRYFTTSQNAEKTYVFQNNVTPRIPVGAIPESGQSIFATLGTSTPCQLPNGRTIQAQTVTYFNVLPNRSAATLASTTTSSAAGASTEQGAARFSSVDRTNPLLGISNELPNFLRSLFSNSGTQSVGSQSLIFTPSNSGAGGSGSGGSVGTGGLGIGKPFGGRIITIIPCLNGALYITLGPPSPGVYVYQAGVSRSFSVSPPIHPGQALLGVAVPGGFCTHGFDVLPGLLILFHGSSI